MDLPPEIAAQLEQLDRQDKGFAIWPANMPIVDAFCAVASQWRQIVFPTGRVHWQGLDYTAVRVGLDGAEIAVTPELWDGITIMERAAAATLNGYRA